MKYLIFIAMAGFLVACGSNGENADNGANGEKAHILELDRKAMEIHDEVMPLMDDMQRTHRELRQVRIELEAHPELEELELRLAETDNAIEFLDKADDAMMVWMQEYRVYATQKDKSNEELLAYYTAEKERITNVGNMMKESLQRGEVTLNRMREVLEAHNR